MKNPSYGSSTSAGDLRSEAAADRTVCPPSSQHDTSLYDLLSVVAKDDDPPTPTTVRTAQIETIDNDRAVALLGVPTV